MSRLMLQIIDYFFIPFHSILKLFNAFGWIVPRWRFTNLISLSLTQFYWFIFGFGSADTHSKVRKIFMIQ